MSLNHLIEQIEEIYSGNPWLEETYSKKLNEVNDQTAFLIPVKGVHSIAEIVSHVVEWKKEILARLQTGVKQLSMHDPLNWRANEELKREGWQHLKTALFNSNNAFVSFLSTQDDTFLDRHYSGQVTETNRYFVEGCLHHDLYHLGQIGVVKKLILAARD